jgi:outer membrane protein assembly factor BamB
MDTELFAVIPTFVIMGPLALLTLLLSAIFGRIHSGLQRWSVLFAVAACDAILYLVHFAFREPWRASWLGSQFTLWVLLTTTTLAGLVWAWRSRPQAGLPDGSAALRPGIGAFLGLGAIALAGLCLVVRSQQQGYPLFHPSLVVWGTTWLSVVYLFVQRLLINRPRAARLLLPPPVAILGTLALNCGLYAATTLCSDRAIVWSFPAEDKGNILSRPVVSADRVYVTVAMNGGGGDLRWGALYCLDRANGEKKWAFTDERQLRPVRGSPCLADGRLYFGDGLPDSHDCSFYCLEAAKGTKQWQFRTKGPLASDPCTADGRVFFHAGVEGVYCLDAATGDKLWQFDRARAEGSPTVAGRYLYAGGSSGGRYELLCLEVATGHPVWRTEVALPLRAAPLCAGNFVFAALGNGTLTRSAELPAGAVVCLEAATGRRVWQYDVSDGVLAQPVVDQASVYFGARDRHCYALDRREGKVRWARDVGSPVVAAPALVGSYLYVPSSQGLLCRLRADTGEVRATYDVAKYTRTKPWLFSSPAVADGHVWFGVGLDDFVGGMVPRLYCLKEDLGRP